MPTETRVLFDVALVAFIVAVVCYAVFGPSGYKR